MKTYGGYLPIELNPGNEYYRSDEKQSVLAFNSCKAAIYYTVMLAGVKRILIPYYICSSMIALIEKAGVKVERYFINQDFMPVDVENLTDEDMLLIVNYFGMTHPDIVSYIKEIPRVIVDNSQAFFEPPVLRAGVYNVYSCKKFIGVPDGGYLITAKADNEEVKLETDFSSEHMDFCITSVEYGTALSYASKKQNDVRIANNPRKMSVMTQKILQNADYERIKQSRRSNFEVIDKMLGQYNQFDLRSCHFIPYYYPLFLDMPIQDRLVKKGVYSPVLWNELFDNRYHGSIEQKYASNIAFLPLDQRYNEDDMMDMCERVKECL